MYISRRFLFNDLKVHSKNSGGITRPTRVSAAVMFFLIKLLEFTRLLEMETDRFIRTFFLFFYFLSRRIALARTHINIMRT